MIEKRGVYFNLLACIITYGCKQNENDSENIKGVLNEIGYSFTDEISEADLIIFNTCAVREGAEDRLFGNVGALKHLKKNKNLIIGICGCMTQQEEVADKIKKSFPHVDFVCGTNKIHLIPSILENVKKERVFEITPDDSVYDELPMVNQSKSIANVSIMYGCNNFCTYCIVPFVRGRERSRDFKKIIREVSQLIENGYKEIILLGQNVNSYRDADKSFSDLLYAVNDIKGKFRVRFISSHPKDFSDELIYAIKNCEKICRQLHLPFQSGSDKILRDMNRKYTSADYLEIIGKVKSEIPGISLSSDVIVGFPTETNEDFRRTVELIEEVRFDTLFTFIYSPRRKTAAEKMKPVLGRQQIKDNFSVLLRAQEKISLEKNEELLGKTVEVLVEGPSKTDANMLTGKTDCGKTVNFKASPELADRFANVEIFSVNTWSMLGKLV